MLTGCVLLSHGADCQVVVAHGTKEVDVVRCPHVIHKSRMCCLVWIDMTTTSVIEWVCLAVGCCLRYNFEPIFVVDIGCKDANLLGLRETKSLIGGGGDALPVVTSADFTAAGLQLGCIDLRRATTPERCGQDIEVPESILKFTDPMADDMAAAGVHAAKMFTPGAAISGCRSWMPEVGSWFLQTSKTWKEQLEKFYFQNSRGQRTWTTR
jgi:hypothetical protein